MEINFTMKHALIEHGNYDEVINYLINKWYFFLYIYIFYYILPFIFKVTTTFINLIFIIEINEFLSDMLEKLPMLFSFGSNAN